MTTGCNILIFKTNKAFIFCAQVIGVISGFYWAINVLILYLLVNSVLASAVRLTQNCDSSHGTGDRSICGHNLTAEGQSRVVCLKWTIPKSR